MTWTNARDFSHVKLGFCSSTLPRRTAGPIPVRALHAGSGRVGDPVAPAVARHGGGPAPAGRPGVTLRDYPAAGLDSRALAEDLRQLRPAYAIWSTGTPTLTHDLALARLVREQAPETVTSVIGTHVTVRPEEALDEAAISAVIRGEPEGIIRDLCRSGGAFGDVAGISWRDARDGAIRHNPDAHDRSNRRRYRRPTGAASIWTAIVCPLKGRRFLMVAPVRGCPWRCSFCTAPLYDGRGSAGGP